MSVTNIDVTCQFSSSVIILVRIWGQICSIDTYTHSSLHINTSTHKDTYPQTPLLWKLTNLVIAFQRQGSWDLPVQEQYQPLPIPCNTAGPKIECHTGENVLNPLQIKVLEWLHLTARVGGNITNHSHHVNLFNHNLKNDSPIHIRSVPWTNIKATGLY